MFLENKRNLKEKLKHWPKTLGVFVSLNKNLIRFWNGVWYWPGQLLVPYRWRTYRDVAFHSDQILRRLIIELINEFKPTTLVETGTFKANTTLFLSRLTGGKIPIYTCEISRIYFWESRWRLRGQSSVTLKRSSSPIFIKKLARDKVLDGLPLFFLDAHGGSDYLPLLDELRELSLLGKAIIIIDDFLVPGRSEFAFDFCSYDTGKIRPLDFSLIKPVLNPGHQYNFLYPNYTVEESLVPIKQERLTGYIVIFVGLKDGFEIWRQKSALPKLYQEAGFPK